MKSKGVFWISFILLIVLQVVCAAEVQQGDEITIITPGTVARLCPHPNCGENQHITRIPEGTALKIEGIMQVDNKFIKVKWFEVTYNEKRGWVSIFDTDVRE